MNPIETKVIQYIDEHADQLIELCSKLIQFNSENPPGNSEPISTYIEQWLNEVKIDVKWHKAKENMWNLTASYNDPASDEDRTLIFCGHTDVVPAGDLKQWDFDPFSGDVQDGWILGRGASDMKGGLAGLIFAVYVLKKLNIDLKGQLKLAIVPDEETGGEFGVPWLLERNLLSGDGCVIAEPSSPFNPTIGQKGSCWFKVHIKGSQAHGSLAPLAGHNAILDALQAIEKIRKLWDFKVNIPENIQPLINQSQQYLRENDRGDYTEALERITTNIGTIQGGTKSNVVPDQCTVEVDCRLPFGVKYEEVIQFVKEELDGLKIDYELEPFGFKSEANYTPADDPVCTALIESIESISKNRAYGVLQWASSDARHFRDYHIPVLQYGPAYLPSIHNFNEKVKVEDVIRCAKVYALTALRFLNN